MQQTKLIFSFCQSGDSVYLKFSNGSESLDFDTQKEVIDGINDCAAKEKISKKEAEQFLKEIDIAVEKGILFKSESRYDSPSGFHRHKCNNCDCIWEHSTSCMTGIHDHECPQCGKGQWIKYSGPKPPTKILKKVSSNY